MTIEPIRNVRGDWWVLAAAFEQLAAYLARGYDPNPSGHIEGDGYYVDVFGLGSIRFSGSNGQTQIVVTPTSGSLDYWMRTLERLQMFNDDAWRLQRDAAPTAEQLVEHYYTSRDKGIKVTLKQLATQYGFNYKYLSSVKAAHDKRRKIQVPLDK